MKLNLALLTFLLVAVGCSSRSRPQSDATAPFAPATASARQHELTSEPTPTSLKFTPTAAATRVVEPTATDPAFDTPITQWLLAELMPLEFVEPQDGDDFSDLLPLKDIIGEARIVALGEATHYTREFFTMKHRLVRFLVQEMGFNMFAMETVWTEARQINDYVLYDHGDITQTLASHLMAIWNTQEVLDLIQWMQQWNQAGGQPALSFHGFDLQATVVATEFVIDYFRIVDPSFAPEASALYACPGGEGIKVGYNLDSPQVQDACRVEITKVYDQLVARQADYTQLTSPKEYELALRHAEYVLQAEECLRDTGPLGPRDRLMAETVTWLLDQAGPDAKIILWAHNGHVADISSSEGASMGHYLREQYGQDLVIVGFAFYEGKRSIHSIPPAIPGSLGWYAHGTGVPQFMLNLQDLDLSRTETAWLTQPIKVRSIGGSYDPDAPEDFYYAEVIPGDVADVLIYIEYSTSTELLPRPDKP